MKNLTATICLAVALLLGSAGVSWSAEPIKGYCLLGTKHSHLPIAGKCSASYERGDYKTALRGFKRLANKGNAATQFNLGQMYRRGQGVQQNYKTAVKWYTHAAKQGNPSAQTNLGAMYANGQGVPQDYKTAVKWYRLAAEQGFAGAQKKLKEIKTHLVSKGIDKCLYEEVVKITGPESKKIVEKYCRTKLEKKSLDWLLQYAD